MLEKIGGLQVEPQEKDAKALEKEKLRGACSDFESILLSQILQSMRSNPLAEENPGQGREIYEGMMDQTLAQSMSRSGSTGLSEVLYGQLSSLIKD